MCVCVCVCVHLIPSLYIYIYIYMPEVYDICKKYLQIFSVVTQLFSQKYM